MTDEEFQAVLAQIKQMHADAGLQMGPSLLSLPLPLPLPLPQSKTVFCQLLEE